jgi:hypothetical protein
MEMLVTRPSKAASQNRVLVCVALVAASLATTAHAQKTTKKDAVQKPDARAKEAAAEEKKAKKDNAEEPKAEEPKPKAEHKPGDFDSDTFAGLQFRSLGPAVASGRVISLAVNPKNTHEFYVGVASGGVWKTINSGTTAQCGLRRRHLPLRGWRQELEEHGAEEVRTHRAHCH